MDRDPVYTNPNNYAHIYRPNNSNSGPPQPQWQPTTPQRPRWDDPRNQTPAHQQAYPSSTPVQPYYNPNQYGPMPSVQAGQPHRQPSIPNAAWGVKYHQAQQAQQQHVEEARPALPPRPASRTDAASTPYQAQTPYSQGRPDGNQTPSTSTQQHSDPWLGYYVTQQEPVPPPPPPRPAAYQNQSNQHTSNQNTINWQHEQYSQHPPSHQYEPSSNPMWGASAASQNPPNTSGPVNPYAYSQIPALPEQPLVSPVEPHNEPWQHSGESPFQAPSLETPSYEQYQTYSGATPKPDVSSPIPAQVATALGPGGLSDWEYFAPNGGAPSPEATYSTPVRPKMQESQNGSHISELSGQSTSKPTSQNKANAQEPRDNTPRPQDQDPTRSRQGSASSSVPEVGVQRTGTIDSVISAWNAPLKSHNLSVRDASISGSPLRQDSVLAADNSHMQAYLQDLRAKSPAPQQLSLAGSMADPYADLEPQYRASLARFVKMLRKEAEAESDEEKYKIFDAFMQKEGRLRAVLYDIDLPPSKFAHPVQLEQKELDKKEPDKKEQEQKLPEQKEQEVINPSNSAREETEPLEDVKPKDLPSVVELLPVQTPKVEADRPKTPPRAPSPKVESSPKSTTDSFVVVNQDQSTDNEEYSPGGRPLIRKPIMVDTRKKKATAPVLNAPAPHEPQPNEKVNIPSPSDDAPQVLTEDYGTGPEPPSLATPIVLVSEEDETSNTAPNGQRTGLSRASTVRFQPPRPAYTPFRYNEGAQTQAETINFHRPADQSYASLRNSTDVGRLMTSDASPLPPNREASKSPTSARKEHEETFLGLIRSHSTAHRKDKLNNVPDSIRPRTAPPSKRILPDPVKAAVEALHALIPANLPEKSQTGKILEGKTRIDQIPDEFGFIRNTVIDWDSANRELRKKMDEERHKRQEESEIHIDELFNRKEIAYADIKDMEADFKLAEAERKYEEDKQELESFSQGVYTPVTAKLQKEIDQLNIEYTLAVDILDLESDPAGRMLNADRNSTRASMALAMDLVLQLSAKFNIRHQKLAEARFERERRRKRLELTVLYTNGDAAGMKKLETEFATAEKLQVLREARERDTRANKLMDTFDRATVAGLGDNQGVMDDLILRVGKVNEALLENMEKDLKSTSIPDAKDLLERARQVAELILEDSRALLTCSNAADMGLNEADYAVSLAEARVSDAGDETLGRLKKDKEREDGKLAEEMGVRMGGIEKGPKELVSLVGEGLGSIAGGMGGGGVGADGGGDGGREERMKRALDEAKMRNMVKPNEG